MATYWVTFRIENVGDHDSRREFLMATLSDLSGGKWWIEPTSFVLFDYDGSVDQVASAVASAIDTTVDLALVGMPNVKAARAIGAITDPDLYDFMPFTKKA